MGRKPQPFCPAPSASRFATFTSTFLLYTFGLSYFTPATFQFLRELEADNSRDWFKANQERYERDVREPALDFITDFTGHLEQLSTHLVADSRKVGGSLFRIQRDARFSKDKTPYKTNTGVRFRHELSKNVHAPGYYLHLQPGNCFMGYGMWRPETKVAYQVRSHIDANQKAWTKATKAKAIAEVFTLGGETLARPPRGYDTDHPLLEDLKRKDFMASTKLTQKQVTAESFLDDYGRLCQLGSPLMAFLCEAVGIPF